MQRKVGRLKSATMKHRRNTHTIQPKVPQKLILISLVSKLQKSLLLLSLLPDLPLTCFSDLANII